MAKKSSSNSERVLFKPFPKQQEFLDAAFAGNHTFILFGGAIRGGKTFSLLALFIILARIFPGSRWVIVRKDLPTIRQNLYPAWHKIKPTNFLEGRGADPNGMTHTSTFKNGSQIIFFPESDERDKEKNRWKGLEANGFGFEEINECQQPSLFKAFERAGSYVVPGLKVQPKPLVVGTCNPSQGWVKDLVYNPWKNGTLKKSWLYIQSRIYDNLPLLEAQPDYLPSLKENLNRYEYEVFVEGNWDVQLKTGGEFLRSFEVDKHVSPVRFDTDSLLRLSIDSNVYPYIALTLWTISKEEDGYVVRQVDEIPAEDPENTASQAGLKVAKWMERNGYTGRILLHGDKSTKNRNNIDDDKRSFFQIVNETIINAGWQTVDRMPVSMPSVASVGDFVNAILEGKIPGIRIEIGEHCKRSINDYIESKTDKDGTILKVKIKHPTIANLTYEKNGHLLDSKKDLIVQSFPEEYIAYVNRHNRLIPGGIASIPRTPKVTF